VSRLGRIDDRGGYFAGDFGGCCHERAKERRMENQEKRERERATNRAKERGCAPLNLGRSGVPCACQNLNVIACISVLVINSNCAPLTKRAEKTQPVGPFFGVGAARPN
jgi:hypothetical protein